MCATIEIVARKKGLNKEDEHKIMELFENKGFLIDITTVARLEEQKRKDIQRIEKYQKENPEEYRMVQVAYAEIDAKEYKLNYNETHKDMIIITSDTCGDKCLCNLNKEMIQHVLRELLDIVDELYYDASAEGYGNPKELFWTSDKEIDINNKMFDWSPSMGYRERVKVTKGVGS